MCFHLVRFFLLWLFILVILVILVIFFGGCAGGRCIINCEFIIIVVFVNIVLNISGGVHSDGS